MKKHAKVEDKTKIMFIVWKWRDFEGINEKMVENGKLKKYLSEINSENPSFFKEYEVEKSRFCISGKVIASYIYNTKETRPLLYALIEKYLKPENEVMVFLHRGDFYEEQDVDDLLSHFKDRVVNCFLFANGRDYIYHKTQNSGFLDDVGGFAKGWNTETGESNDTFKDNKIQQPYFDRVWEYYSMEFETKVFHLKEELFDRWLPFLLPDQPEKTTRAHLIAAIQEDDERLLWLRLKSFTDIFQEALGKAEEEDDPDQADEIEDEKAELIKLEKVRKVSYFFDDCIKNLNHHRKIGRFFVADAYDEAKTTLKKILFDEAPETLEIPQTTLRKLAEQLNYLIKVIPGELN